MDIGHTQQVQKIFRIFFRFRCSRNNKFHYWFNSAFSRRKTPLTNAGSLVYFKHTVADIATAHFFTYGPDTTTSNSCLCVGLYLYSPTQSKRANSDIPSVRLEGLFILALLGNSLAHQSTMGPKEGYLLCA